jgi:hypothetical protein
MRLHMKALVLFALATGLAACATSSGRSTEAPSKAIKYEGGDGLTCESRVIIKGATGSRQGVAAEYDWLRTKYPGHQVQGQSLSKCAGKPADVLEITTAEGKSLALYFDISDFFGREFGLAP